MKTYKISVPDKKPILSTDLIDVLNEIENAPDKTKVEIEVREMTAQEFQNTVDLNNVLNMSIRIPWKNGPE